MTHRKFFTLEENGKRVVMLQKSKKKLAKVLTCSSRLNAEQDDRLEKLGPPKPR